jgi:tetratricopeptide (TPR) repeat protein
MDKARREQIYKNLLQKSTQELLEIWQEQNLEGWEKGVFEIIKQILLERLGELPTLPLDAQVEQILNRAEKLLEAGNFDQALTECELAIQMMPENAAAYNLRGMVYEEMGQLEKAILEYQTTIQLDPDWKEAWDDLKNAEKALEKEFQQSSAKQHLDQALLYAEDDEMDHALAECELARQTIPPIAMAHNYLGLVLHQTNRLEAAIEAYLKAISFNPKFYAARQNLRDARVKLKEDQFLSSIMKNESKITPEPEILSIEDDDIWLLDDEADNTDISGNEMDEDIHDEEEDTPP